MVDFLPGLAVPATNANATKPTKKKKKKKIWFPNHITNWAMFGRSGCMLNSSGPALVYGGFLGHGQCLWVHHCLGGPLPLAKGKKAGGR
jgi:hypothetical protein